MTTKTWMCIAVTAWMGASAASFGDAPAGAPPSAPARGAGGPGAGMPGLAQKLGLTDAQQKKFQAAMQTHRSMMQTLGQQRRLAVEKLRTLLQANAGDENYQEPLTQLKGVQKAMQLEQEQFRQTLAGFLTPKQQAQMLLGALNRMASRGPAPAGAAEGGPEQSEEGQ